MKHTKGPWKIEHYRQDGCLIANIFVLKNEMSANEFMTSLYANKALIAAAPEMLEALEEVESFLYSDYPNSDTGDRERVYKLIDKLINKAKGGTNE